MRARASVDTRVARRTRSSAIGAMARDLARFSRGAAPSRSDRENAPARARARALPPPRRSRKRALSHATRGFTPKPASRRLPACPPSRLGSRARGGSRLLLEALVEKNDRLAMV